MKACRCTRGELGFGDDSFRFRVGNAGSAKIRTVLGGVRGGETSRRGSARRDASSGVFQ